MAAQSRLATCQMCSRGSAFYPHRRCRDRIRKLDVPIVEGCRSPDVGYQPGPPLWRLRMNDPLTSLVVMVFALRYST